MAYRDENEALREKVAELERKLALSEALVERLLGRGGGTATRKPDSLVGEVVHRVDETSLEVTLDAAGLAAAKRVVEARLGHEVKEREGTLEGRRTAWAFLGERRDAPAFGLARTSTAPRCASRPTCVACPCSSRSVPSWARCSRCRW